MEYTIPLEETLKAPGDRVYTPYSGSSTAPDEQPVIVTPHKRKRQTMTKSWIYLNAFFFQCSICHGIKCNGQISDKRANKALYMNISAEKWTAAPYLDYGGIMKLKQYSFLLRGDLDQDSIFTKTNSVPLKILLQKEGADSSSRFFPEPPLQRTYYICKPMPINLEIYTKGSIKNFDMKIRSSNY